MQSRHAETGDCHQEVPAGFTVKIPRVGDHHSVPLQLFQHRLHLSAFVRRLRHGAEREPFYTVTEVRA